MYNSDFVLDVNETSSNENSTSCFTANKWKSTRHPVGSTHEEEITTFCFKPFLKSSWILPLINDWTPNWNTLKVFTQSVEVMKTSCRLINWLSGRGSAGFLKRSCSPASLRQGCRSGRRDWLWWWRFPVKTQKRSLRSTLRQRSRELTVSRREMLCSCPLNLSF